jgi:hypothetical protein
VTLSVDSTGVLVRMATAAEAESARRARRGGEFVLTPPRSYDFTRIEGTLADDELYVVSQAFVEITNADAQQRWTGTEHHGHALSMKRDESRDLLKLAQRSAEDLIDLLADMRIAQLRVSRWQLRSAPHRIELQPDLKARLAPLRRG